MITIIHIGKCGGSSICKNLKDNNIKYEKIHVEKVIYKQININYNQKPIQRFISAFYGVIICYVNLIQKKKVWVLKNKFYKNVKIYKNFVNI